MHRQRDVLRLFADKPRTLLCHAVFITLLLSFTLAAQETSSETLKAQAVDVVVDVIVSDKNGRHVPGLQASDFSIIEDGVPQKIASFSESRSTIADDKTSVPGSAQTVDAPPAAAAARPHLLTVVMDLADSRPDNLRRSAEAVVNYLEKKLTPNDFVAIYYIDRALRLALPFTNNLTEARAALAKIGTGVTAVHSSASERSLVQSQIDELYARIHPEALVGIATDAVPSRDNPQVALLERELQTLRTYLLTQNTLQAKAVFVALRAICTSYQDLPGRKNVVLFSEGFLYADDARPEMEAVADAANRSNVALYVIDPVGLEVGRGGAGPRNINDTLTSQMMSIASQGPAAVGHSHGVTKFDTMRALGTDTRNQQLEWLANLTGGLMVKNRNDLGPAFARAVDDARDFYSISYQPANKELDGKFRKIKLEMTERGYRLRYRQGYWAIPHAQAVAMSPAAVQMLAGVSSKTYQPAFRPELYANLLLAPDGKFVVPVSVSFAGENVRLEALEQPETGKVLLSSNVMLVLIARDAEGAILATRQRQWPIHIEKKDKDEFLRKNLTLQTEIAINQLAPITVQAIVSLPGGVLASNQTDLKVTDPAAGPQLTSIMFTAQAEKAACPDKSDPLCLENVRLVQPAKAEFTANSRLIVYFSANGLMLDPQTKQPRIGVDLRLKSGDMVLKSPAAENLQALAGPVPGSVTVLAELDLRSLAQGNYAVQVTARDLVKKASAQNLAEFTLK